MATVLPETRATEKRPPGQAAPRQRRTPGLAVAVTPLVAMGVLLGIGYGVYHLPSTVLLILAAFVTGSLGLALGFGWREMERGIVEAITKAMPAILVVLAIGMLIGSWLACGTRSRRVWRRPARCPRWPPNARPRRVSTRTIPSGNRWRVWRPPWPR